MDLIAAAGKDDILLAGLDQFTGVADAVRAGGAGRTDGIVHPLDPVGHGEAGAVGAGHDPGHQGRPDLARAARAQDVDGRLHIGVGTAAGTDDKAGARLADVALLQGGIGDGLAHRDIAVGRAVAHKAPQFAVNPRVQIDINRAMHMRAQAEFGIFGGARDAGDAVFERGQHLPPVIPDTRHDPHAGDNDPFQCALLEIFR